MKKLIELDARRYTFGNEEFSLEAAYHDCKLVFDGITDDDSFQEADTGLILYYANEIIYALQEALEGKDTNGAEIKQIEAVPVRHGKWMLGVSLWYCSECGSSYSYNDYLFCPHCGAKMDVKDGEQQ